MTYVSGFMLAVPTANKEAYRKQAAEAWPMFLGYGALCMVEGWGDDVPDGKVHSINSAVMAAWRERRRVGVRSAKVSAMRSMCVSLGFMRPPH